MLTHRLSLGVQRPFAHGAMYEHDGFDRGFLERLEDASTILRGGIGYELGRSIRVSDGEE